jgi:hypothetical protein
LSFTAVEFCESRLILRVILDHRQNDLTPELPLRHLVLDLNRNMVAGEEEEGTEHFNELFNLLSYTRVEELGFTTVWELPLLKDAPRVLSIRVLRLEGVFTFQERVRSDSPRQARSQLTDILRFPLSCCSTAPVHCIQADSLPPSLPCAATPDGGQTLRYAHSKRSQNRKAWNY